MKGVLQNDHFPLNKFELTVLGVVGKLTLTSVTDIEEIIDVVDLPDKTVASGGRSGPIEMTVTLPMHHQAEQLQMELWYKMSKDPVMPGYKRPATLTLKSLTGGSSRSYGIVGLFPFQRTLPDFEMSNMGEMAEVEWVLRADGINPI